MATLRIEHAIADYQTWRQAFDGFAAARATAGVRDFTIRQPVDDPKYLTLVGAPHTRILELRR